jgi:predicted nucleic acid-binding protein
MVSGDDEHALERAARRPHVYDAADVALAETMDVVLLTADARLAGAPGARCEVELLAN